MEKPGWAPLVLRGAVPKGAGDFLAIIVIGLGTLEASLIQPVLPVAGKFPLLALITSTSTCALASLTNTNKKVREELALLAYGGSPWHAASKYFLRGLACTIIAITPVFALQAEQSGFFSREQILFALTLAISGGVSYSLPSIRRSRSNSFVELYKG